MGNNKNGKRGTPLLIVREVRIWTTTRTLKQIIAWRFKSVDPRLSDNQGLISNFRANSGGQSDINFISADYPANNTQIELSDFSIVTNSKL